MTTKSDRFDLSGNPYDISANCIVTRADMDGASVFVIEGRIGKLRVLDFSEREAELTYKEEADEVDPRCPECGRKQTSLYGDSELCECESTEEDPD